MKKQLLAAGLTTAIALLPPHSARASHSTLRGVRTDSKPGIEATAAAAAAAAPPHPPDPERRLQPVPRGEKKHPALDAAIKLKNNKNMLWDDALTKERRRKRQKARRKRRRRRNRNKKKKGGAAAQREAEDPHGQREHGGPGPPAVMARPRFRCTNNPGTYIPRDEENLCDERVDCYSFESGATDDLCDEGEKCQIEATCTPPTPDHNLGGPDIDGREVDGGERYGSPGFHVELTRPPPQRTSPVQRTIAFRCTENRDEEVPYDQCDVLKDCYDENGGTGSDEVCPGDTKCAVAWNCVEKRQ